MASQEDSHVWGTQDSLEAETLVLCGYQLDLKQDQDLLEELPLEHTKSCARVRALA
jgi:hypothetical protein